MTTSLGGTRVLFDGVAAPMIYTLQGQVSAVTPFQVAARASTTVEVEFQGVRSNPVVLDVAATAPGIFTAGSVGAGQGAILNQDYTPNGPDRSARKGSVVFIYATGGGQTEPGGVDGKVVGPDLPRLLASVSVQIGGIDAELYYAGPAPGIVSGVLQVNAKVPENLIGAGAVPVEVTVGGVKSQPGVTLSVEGSGADGGSAALEERLRVFRTDPTVPPLEEIPHDRVGIPSGWLALVSWNVQAGGTSPSPDALRPEMVQAALGKMFGGAYQILASQEIPNAESAGVLTKLLPGGPLQWTASFFDTTDSMDNGVWHRAGVTCRDAFPLFTGSTLDGRVSNDPTYSVQSASCRPV